MGRIGAACQIEHHKAWLCVLLPRHVVQGEQGFVPNAARRDVDDAIQAGFIGGIMNEAEEGDDILDFPAPIESLRADESIRKPRLEERFF